MNFRYTQREQREQGIPDIIKEIEGNIHGQAFGGVEMLILLWHCVRGIREPIYTPLGVYTDESNSLATLWKSTKFERSKVESLTERRTRQRFSRAYFVGRELLMKSSPALATKRMTPGLSSLLGVKLGISQVGDQRAIADDVSCSSLGHSSIALEAVLY